jgi:hypothetical protein
MHAPEVNTRHERGYDLQQRVCGTVDRLNRRSDMALPTLTPEQRADALAKAQAARKERSELLASVKAGKVSIAQLLNRTDNVAKKTKVSQVIRALPGYGPAKAAAVMEEAGIDDNRRVGGLGDQQRRKLLEAVAG